MTKIKEIRLEKKLNSGIHGNTTANLAELLRQNRKGKKELTILLLVQLSKIFNINTTQLFEEPTFEYSNHSQQSMELINNRNKNSN